MFGTFIRELRGQRGVTETARAIGVDRTAVHQWENGTKSPEPGNLQALLDLFGATDEQRLEAWRLRSLPRNEPAAEAPSQEASEDPVPARAAS